MTALYLVGDVFDRVAELRRRRVRVALVLCSPPFLALRYYLPDGHPLKASEIGSEATPAAFIDVMLALVAALAHMLEPWGSIAFELGDTFSGSGGAGGDYDLDGLRAGQPGFGGSAKVRRTAGDYPVRDDNPRPSRSGRTRADGNGKVFRGGQRQDDKQGTSWPEDKSLAGIPQAFMLSLAYGYNVLDRRGPDSPAGRWRVRNFKPWIRSNPPVGALGDKERPATSYVIVATRAVDRYFDLDAVRTAPVTGDHHDRFPQATYVDTGKAHNGARQDGGKITGGNHPAGAPPRDWWHHVDAVLDACLDDMAGKPNAGSAGRGDRAGGMSGRLGPDQNGDRYTDGATSVGARGVHLRRALERAGILATVDAIDCSPKGYRGAHYAVWPPDLVKQLVLEMCPRRVCSTCGQPSRRIVGKAEYVPSATHRGGSLVADSERLAEGVNQWTGPNGAKASLVRSAPTLGWSDCGHGTWTPGVVLDPFVGSGTTLQVCTGLGRDSIGIDLDYTNVGLAMERVGMWLAVEWPEPDLSLPALGPGSPHPVSYERWARLTGNVWHVWGTDDEREAKSWRLVGDDVAALPAPKPPKRRQVPAVAGQAAMF